MRIPLLAALLMISPACSPQSSEKPGEVPVFDAIGADEVINVLGTEPFWSARIEGARLIYSTPENMEGTQVPIERFAGNGGLGISGTLDGTPLQLAITPGDCSDGMSARSYPYAATLSLGGENLLGCAYTNIQGFTGEENP